MNLKLKQAALPLAVSLLAAAASVQANETSDQTSLRMIPELSTGFMRNFNPLNNTTRLRTTRDFMYEPLLIVNEFQGGAIHYRLAESAEFSDDLLSLTITMREGLKWSDGETLDGNDLVFTLEMIQRHPEIDEIGLMTDQVKEVTLVDDRTVVLTLAEADFGFLTEIADAIYVVPAHAWADVTDPNTFTNENPVGSGPMTEIQRFTRNIYRQCRNPYYWDADNLQVECLELPQVVDNNAALIAARDGSIDWMGIGMMEPERVFVSHNPEYHNYWFPAGATMGLALNFANETPAIEEAFSSLEFRKAMSLAMDRQAMVDFANPAATKMTDITGMGATFSAWVNPEVAEQYDQYLEFNIEKAKEYLATAGFVDTNRNGFVETPSGLPLEIEIQVPNGWTDWVNTVEIAIEGLRDAGINSRMSTPEWGLIIDRRAAGEFQALTNGFASGVDPFTYFNFSFHSRYQDACNEGGNQGWFAISRYCNPELDALLDSFNKTADPDERMSIMHQVQAVWAADMPTISLYNNPTWYQYSTERFTGWWNADNPVGNPTVNAGNGSRLLLLLDLEPRQ